MARKDHGLDLTRGLVLQPGSKFKRTQSGFDTGFRVYKVDRRINKTFLPTLGQADKTLPSGRYAQMFVESIDVDEGTNQIDTITVNFLGLRDGPKPVTLTGSTSSSQAAEGATVIQDITPAITVVYVQDRPPDLWEVGQPKLPPLGVKTSSFSPNYLPVLAATPTGLNLGTRVRLFEGWVVASRPFRQIGNLWELTDAYEYQVVYYNPPAPPEE